MAVQVSDICDRCGRSTPVHMSNDELVAETEKRKTIEAGVKVLEQQVTAMDPNVMPTLFIAYKGTDGKVVTKSLISICDPKAEGKRSCTKRVFELISDLFPIPADARAPRKPKEKKASENGGAKGKK